MHYSKRNKPKAEKIINDLIKTDHPETLKKTLQEIVLGFYMFYENPTEEFKGEVYSTFVTLTDFLTKVSQLKSSRR